MAGEGATHNYHLAVIININETHEVQYWCSKLDCSKEQLHQAILVVGNSVTLVCEHLGVSVRRYD